MIMRSRKNKSTHGETFFSAVRGTPWDDAAPLAQLLGATPSPPAATLTLAHARALWKELSYLGSNDLAYLIRRLKGVDYPEIVRDVCKHLKISELQPGEAESVVELNEQLVIRKIFADAWEHLDAEERRELLREMKLDGAHPPLEGAPVVAAVLAGEADGFTSYNLSSSVANWVARALLGQGQEQGDHAALARVLGVPLGPVGWLASGASLLTEVTSPALRKTVPAVVLVASLRQAKRAALAETVLADVETPAASPAPRANRKKRAVKKAAKRPLASPLRAKSTKKTKKKVARPQRATRGAKKAASKKLGKRKAAKKKRSRKGPR